MQPIVPSLCEIDAVAEKAAPRKLHVAPRWMHLTIDGIKAAHSPVDKGKYVVRTSFICVKRKG